MGNSVIGKYFKPQKTVRILIQGLDAAGKTTLLYRMKLGEVVTTIPTIGFNVETLEYKHTVLTVWDIGGRDKIRPLYRHYYLNTDALVFVIDSNDRDRLDEIRDEMAIVSSENELQNCVIAVVANKQDLPNAMTVSEMHAALNLDKLFGRHRIYNIFGATATTGEGLYEIFDWLSRTLSTKTNMTDKQNLKSKSNESTMETFPDMGILVKPFYKLKEMLWM